MRCQICYHKMIKNPGDFSFYSGGRKISIQNYPFYVCPKCANVVSKRKDMGKAVSFFYKKTDQDFSNDQKFEF